MTLIWAVVRVVVKENPWTILPWAVLTAIALVVRHRAPIVAIALAIVASAGVALIGATVLPTWTATQLVLMSVTLSRGRVRSVFPAIGVLASLYLCSVFLNGDAPLEAASLGVVPWTLGVWGFAVAVYSQREAVAVWKERASRLQHTREEEIRRRIAEERLRIARDLHDELAHQIAVISVNAGAAEVALSGNPESSRRSLRTVREASRHVLSELHQILGVLRSGDGEDEGAGSRMDIGMLIDSARAAGLHVDAGEIELNGLRPDGKAAAYRVVQESLTNARRYGDGHVTLDVATAKGTWVLTVSNRLGPAAAGFGGGFGLIGMRERIDQAGGRLKVDHDGERFLVRVELPTSGGAVQ